MLVLGGIKQRVKWPAAGIWLDLVPLPEDKDQAFVQETMTEVRDDDGKLINIQRDATKYAQLVGRYCIKDWGNVVGDGGVEAHCTPENIDDFMLIGEAQEFVFGKVKGLALYRQQEIEDAGNA